MLRTALWLLPTAVLITCLGFAQETGLVGSLERVSRYQRLTSLKVESRFFAARGETISFQLVLKAGSQLSGVDIAADNLYSSESSIKAGNITVYREHYLPLRQSSPGAPVREEELPDALIPLRHPATGMINQGGSIAAANATIPAGTNQPYWVDVAIPSSAIAGAYSGSLTVMSEGSQIASVDFTIVVWNAALPATPALGTSFGFGTRDQLQEFYKLERWSRVEYEMFRRFADCLLDHRLAFPFSRDMQVSARADGSFDPLTGEGQWNTREVFDYYLKERSMSWVNLPMWDDWPIENPFTTGREKAIRYLRSFLRFAESGGWADRVYCYMLDEPSSLRDYEQARRWGALCNEADPRLKHLLTEQPQPQQAGWGNLAGFVDIWVVLPKLFDQHVINQRLASGDMVWLYTALKQDDFSPKWLLDYHPIEYRIYPWIIYSMSLHGLLYWETTYWLESSDVWTDPVTFRDGGAAMLGDGMLIYPGTTETVGFDGPVPSMRLKWIRDGVEDFDLIKLAEATRKKKAGRLARRVAKNLEKWTAKEKKLLRIRKRLGGLADKSSYRFGQ